MQKQFYLYLHTLRNFLSSSAFSLANGVLFFTNPRVFARALKDSIWCVQVGGPREQAVISTRKIQRTI